MNKQKKELASTSNVNRDAINYEWIIFYRNPEKCSQTRRRLIVMGVVVIENRLPAGGGCGSKTFFVNTISWVSLKVLEGFHFQHLSYNDCCCRLLGISCWWSIHLIIFECKEPVAAFAHNYSSESFNRRINRNILVICKLLLSIHVYHIIIIFPLKNFSQK